jgi:hypothetical protein
MNRYEEKANKFAYNYGKENSYIGKENTKMTTAEVIAMNIQTSQIKEVLPHYEWTDEKIAEEKAYFKWWICNPNQGGRFDFKDNLSAWEMYKLIHETYEIDDGEEFTPSWLEEIEMTINQAVRIANYSDYGGQQ